MQQRNRQYRRHQVALKKQRVSHYGQAGYWYRDAVPQTDTRVIGKVATTPSACGCWMCANARRVFGIPFSETRRKLCYTGGE